jgi:peptidoglycan lytic transglycosylase G
VGSVARKLILIAALGALSALVLLALAYWQLMSWADRPMSNTPLQFVLKPGQNLSELAQDLSVQGFEDRYQLVLYARITGADTSIQAGEYLVEAGLSPRQMLEKLRTGDVIIYDFRLEEGSTIASVLRRIHQNSYMLVDITATDAQSLHHELGLEVPFAEGMFFPDTYHFHRGDSARALLLRAHYTMLDRLQTVWDAAADHGALDNPLQALILASIIEKETGQASDRAQISQVFHKRLGKRMLLQTDPTVIYALGEAFDGNLTRAHLKIDSPFNTYKYRGLPPTPIALPSAASLEAAVSPAEGDYLYFVAKGNGASQFSRTLAEHNRAVRKYQLQGSKN